MIGLALMAGLFCVRPRVAPASPKWATDTTNEALALVAAGDLEGAMRIASDLNWAGTLSAIWGAQRIVEAVRKAPEPKLGPVFEERARA